MSYSLNEIQATATKAARAAGYPWGIAEEVAKSARWLCSQGIDGCAVLARHLEFIDQSDIARRTPVVQGGQWQAHSESLCPVLAGTALSDRANTMDESGISLLQVSEPLLLLYFAALAARKRRVSGHTDAVLSVAWLDSHFATDGESLFVSGSINQHSMECVDEVVIKLDDTLGSKQDRCNRANPTELAWQSLSDLAFRTYAPATEQSRLTGAGAGLSDND